jgi:hypothetical protein
MTVAAADAAKPLQGATDSHRARSGAATTGVSDAPLSSGG